MQIKIAPIMRAWIYTILTTYALLLYNNIGVDGSSNSTILYYQDNSLILNLFPLPYEGLSSLFLMIALYFYYKYCNNSIIQNDISAVLLSILFTIGLLIGASYSVTNSWYYLFGNAVYIVRTAFIFIGLLILLNSIIQLLYMRLDTATETESLQEIPSLLKAHPFIFPFLLIVVTWIIVVVLIWPGSAYWDGLVQLNQYYGFTNRVDKHPWFSTLLLGSIIDFGSRLINNNFGLFLWVLFQTIISSLVFSLIVKLLIDNNCPKLLIYATIIGFAFNPIWISYAINIYKDFLFAVMLALSVLLLAKILDSPFSDKRAIFEFVIVCCVCSLLRKNGIYAITAMILTAMIFTKGKRRQLAIAMAVFTVIFAFCQGVVAPSLGFEKGTTREALSLPFQQTARYMVEYGNDISEEERLVVNKVLPVDELAGLYKPNLSDPVKSRYNENATLEDLLQYINVYLRLFFRHPDTYLQAFFNQTYAYWSPDVIITDHTDKFIWTSSSWEKGKYPNEGDIQFTHPYNSQLPELLRKLSYNISYVPIIGLPFQAGTYVWLFAIILFYSFSRNKKQVIIISIPSLITILISALSPVNGCIRYLLPVIACLPIMALYLFKLDDNRGC